jgi:3-deoxy-D-manno-octulosonate 8-phosphate phosphatase (KDO 8-P phosphatase)
VKAKAGPRSFREKASRIRLLVLDVDGVLTDGVLVYGASGEEIKRFHVRDGLAIQQARRAGVEVAIVSGRASAAVTRRMSELGVVEVHQGVGDKESLLRGLLARLAVGTAETAVMGDDLPDLPLMRIAGLAMAPADAVPEVRQAAGWVSRSAGGHGAVREAVEMLLRSRKAWPPRK